MSKSTDGKGSASATDEISAALAGIDEQIQAATLQAVALQKEITLQQSSLDMRADEMQSLKQRLDELGSQVGKFRKFEYEMRSAIEADEDRMVSAQKTVDSGTRELSLLKLHQIDGDASPVLAVYEDEKDLAGECG